MVKERGEAKRGYITYITIHMTKKKVLIGSGILAMGIIFFDYIGTYSWCDYFIFNGHQGNCPFILSGLEMLFFPVLPLFLFSLITYRLRAEAFQSWWKFARIATPLSMFLIFIAPSYSHDWMFPIEKGSVALMTTILFIFISIILLIRTHRSLRA
jgi:glucan phosphoethanolaminetransferase (alkaline phosphatase superfamily)